MVAAMLANTGGVQAGHATYNTTYYCGIGATASPNPAPEGATITHRITYCQKFMGYTTASSYLGSSRVDTGGPQHLNGGQSGTITNSFSAGGPGSKELYGYIVSALTAYPTPTYQNGYDHIDLTVVGNPSTPSVGEDHAPASWGTHNHPHWTWGSSAAFGSIARYEVDPTWTSAFTTTATDWHPTLGSGSYGVRVRAQNNVGVWSGWSGTVYAYIDTAPPATLLGLSGPAGSAGWFRGTTTATLSASDPHSGVASTSYNRDGAGWTAYGSPVAISGDGFHTFGYYSTDKVGNAEGIRTPSVNIDGTPPATSIGVGAPSLAEGGRTYLTSASRVSLAASDATSGVAATSWALDGGAARPYAGAFTVTGGDGPRGLQAWSADVAGNVEGAKGLALFLDNTPPSSRLVAGAPKVPDMMGTFVNSGTPLDIAATDAGSGVASTRYRVNGGAWQTAGTFHLTGPDGRYTVDSAATDRLGNAEPPAATALQLDNTPPALAFHTPAPDTLTVASTTIAVPLPDCAAGAAPCAAPLLAKANRPAVVVTGATVVLGSDAADRVVNGVASGMAKVRYTLDGELLAEVASAPWSFAWDTGPARAGERVLTATALDRLGNAASVERKLLLVAATPAGAAATAAWAVAQARDTAGPVAGDPAGYVARAVGEVQRQVPGPPSGVPQPPAVPPAGVPQVPPVPPAGLPQVPPGGVPQVPPAPAIPPAGVPPPPSGPPNVRPVATVVFDPNERTVYYRLGLEVNGAFVGDERFLDL